MTFTNYCTRTTWKQLKYHFTTWFKYARCSLETRQVGTRENINVATYLKWTGKATIKNITELIILTMLSEKEKLKRAKLKARKLDKKEKKRTSIKVLTKKADDLWSLAVKKWGKCEVCWITTYLNAHHIFSRHNKSTRWDLDNGICLCSGCHVFSDKFSAHKTPTDFTYWLEKQYSKEYIEILARKAHKPITVTSELLQEIIEKLKEKL